MGRNHDWDNSYVFQSDNAGERCMAIWRKTAKKTQSQDNTWAETRLVFPLKMHHAIQLETAPKLNRGNRSTAKHTHVFLKNSDCYKLDYLTISPDCRAGPQYSCNTVMNIIHRKNKSEDVCCPYLTHQFWFNGCIQLVLTHYQLKTI